MKKQEILTEVEALVRPIAEENGYELVDVEYVKEGGTWYLRAYIDKPGGITVDDCETVSREFSDRLDEEDFIEDSYVMEVSSPGLGRPLKKDRDYARCLGKEVELKTYKPVEKEKEFTGTLKAYDEDKVTIILEDNREMTLNRKDLALIREAVDF